MQYNCIITGCSSGIGIEILNGLAKRNDFTNIFLFNRNEEKSKNVIDNIKNNTNCDTKFHHITCDLSSFESVKTAVNIFLDFNVPLNFLINNAGCNYVKEILSVNNYETIYQTNYLSHYLLTRLLMNKLKATAENSFSQVINVSSVMHRFGDSHFEKFQMKRYSSTYSTSKLAQILQSVEYNRQMAVLNNSDSVCVSPGSVNSDIWRHVPSYVELLFKPIRNLFLLTPTQGASTTLNAVALRIKNSTNTEWKTLYLSPYSIPSQWLVLPLELISKFNSHSTSVQPSSTSMNKQLAMKLWNLSEKWVEDFL